MQHMQEEVERSGSEVRTSGNDNKREDDLHMYILCTVVHIDGVRIRDNGERTSSNELSRITFLLLWILDSILDCLLRLRLLHFLQVFGGRGRVSTGEEAEESDP